MPGISIAPAANWNVAAPTWIRLDSTYRVRSWTVDRGRPNEMGRIDTGTASFELVDRVGAFDPTNATSPFFGQLTAGEPMGPLVQAKIELQHPLTSTWETIFRGFISRIQWVPYITEEHANVTIDLVDGLAILAAIEMSPGVDVFGDDNDLDGNIVFNEDLTLTAVQTRIDKVLTQASWPSSLRAINTGNVKLLGLPPSGVPDAGKGVYAPRSSVLSVVQDAADAEMPDTALVFIGGPRNPGYLVFHGRKVRFNPGDVSYGVRTWQLGDNAQAAAYATTVPVSPPLVASLDDTLLYTSALSTPQGIADGAINGQYVNDAARKAKIGLRTWSAENLQTGGGASTSTAEAETKLFANYVITNYNRPRVRVGQLTVKPRQPGHFNDSAIWNLLTQVDISDIVQLTTTHGGGGGFADPFYVEGIHYSARPGGPRPYVELTLDVSPKGYYDANPFPP